MPQKVRASQKHVVFGLNIALYIAYFFPMLFVASLGDLEAVSKQSYGSWMKDTVDGMSPFVKAVIQVRAAACHAHHQHVNVANVLKKHAYHQRVNVAKVWRTFMLCVQPNHGLHVVGSERSR